MSRLDVGNDQSSPEGARFSCGDAFAERDRAPGPRWRELDDTKIIPHHDVVIEPPPEARVKLLCTIDVRNGNQRDLELGGNSRDIGVILLLFKATHCLTHVILL